ncbi:MAG: hypothetical protein M3P14_10960 [Chloroflexota bacterium]|nr:hypothetical protein [Chloroflexota bacterium]
MNLSEQLRQLSPTRRALLAAGTVTLALSMALSIAPTLAAGGGNSGTVKIHGVDTTADDTSNDPHVCAFTVVFDGFDAGATGTWEIASQAPGDGSVVASGDYVIGGAGQDETASMTLPAGHYQLGWTEGATSKHKTFWVADNCGGENPGDTGGTTDPGDTGGTTDTGDTGGTTDPGNTGDTGGTTDPGNTVSDTQTDQPGQPTEGGVQAATGSSEGTTSSLPNTAFAPSSVSLTPLLRVLGLLLIVAAHPFIRRSAQADRA